MEEEVASYVLAYLLKGNYPKTATAFLQECAVLPRSLMVLPQTPLLEIISTYKAWKDANVLKDALGPTATLSALWSKLDQTLIQIKKLSEEMMVVRDQPKIVTSKGSLHVNVTTVQSAPNDSSTQGYPCSAKSLSTVKPPKRKRPHPQRNARTTIDTNAIGINNPVYSDAEISHLLDSFLSDTTLTERLADIINKCVERPRGEELSSATLDHILDLTCTEPAFESVLKAAETPVVSSAGNEDEILEPPSKKERGEDSGPIFPSTMDLDSFLDRVHAA